MVIEDIRQMTVEEYFAFDEASEYKNEYIDGEVFPMTGGTTYHAAIMANTSGTLWQRLKGSNCRLFSSAMRVRINPKRYLYPDLSVVCGAPTTDARAINLFNPTLVAEVTSPSTAYYDRGEKLRYYQSIPSLRVILIIDQLEALIGAYLRHEEGWLLREYSDLDAVIPLPALGCDLPLAEVYAGIDF